MQLLLVFTDVEFIQYWLFILNRVELQLKYIAQYQQSITNECNIHE